MGNAGPCRKGTTAPAARVVREFLLAATSATRFWRLTTRRERPCAPCPAVTAFITTPRVRRPTNGQQSWRRRRRRRVVCKRRYIPPQQSDLDMNIPARVSHTHRRMRFHLTIGDRFVSTSRIYNYIFLTIAIKLSIVFRFNRLTFKEITHIYVCVYNQKLIFKFFKNKYQEFENF